MRDFISQLPDELLHKILLNLMTIESVRTSVLSTRWRHLWQGVPGLIFDCYDEHDVLDFMDIFLNLDKELSIHRFALRCSNFDIPCLKLLIDQVLTRGVQHLSITSPSYFIKRRIIKFPASIYTCETLVNLHLVHVELDDFDGNEVINLPRLQVMDLDYVLIPSDVVLEMLISCSPVLQDLRLYHIKAGCVKVRSQTLRNLIITWICKQEYKLPGDGGECRVVIDTPNLEFLSIQLSSLDTFKVESVSSSIKICIGDNFSNTQTLHNFFAEISRVTELSISGITMRMIYDNYLEVLQYQPLPELKNLTCLYAYFCRDSSEILPMYLSSCPNLKSIVLEFCYSPNMEKIAYWPVPQCLQTSIENVKLKMTPKAHEESSRKAQIELAKYILENATALKKFTLCLDEKEDVCNSVLEQILTFRNQHSVEVKIRPADSYPCRGFMFERLSSTGTPFLVPSPYRGRLGDRDVSGTVRGRLHDVSDLLVDS